MFMQLKLKKEYYLPIILILWVALLYPIWFYVGKVINSDDTWQNLSLALFLTRLQQIVPMAVIGLFFLYFLFHFFLKKKKLEIKFLYEKILLLFFPLSFIGFLVGVINKNSWFYNIGDSYSLALIPIIYFVGLFFYSQDLKVEKIFKYILYIFLFFSLMDFSLQIFNFIYYKKLIYLSFFNYSLPLIYFLLLENKKLKHYSLISILLISIILTLKRGNWLFTFLTFILVFLLTKNKKKMFLDYLKLFLILIFIAGLLFLIFKPIFLNEIFPRFEKRINETIGFDVSMQERYKEFTTIWNQLIVEGSIFNYLLGFGNGAVYKVQYYLGEKAGDYYFSGSPETVHTMHNTWAAFLFRTGAIGLLLYFIFAISLIKILYQHIKKQNSENNLIFYLTVLFIWIFLRLFVNSFSSYVFWQDVWLGVLLTLSGYLMRRIEEKNNPLIAANINTNLH